MKKLTLVALDHFGVAYGHLIRDTFEKSTNKRKRDSARKELVRVAKATSTIPKGIEGVGVSTFVEPGGLIYLGFHWEEQQAEGTSVVLPATPPEQRAQAPEDETLYVSPGAGNPAEGAQQE